MRVALFCLVLGASSGCMDLHSASLGRKHAPDLGEVDAGETTEMEDAGLPEIDAFIQPESPRDAAPSAADAKEREDEDEPHEAAPDGAVDAAQLPVDAQLMDGAREHDDHDDHEH